MRHSGADLPCNLRRSLNEQAESQEMNEGLFYGMFFTGILINYAVKLNLESKGKKLERSTAREGLIMGVSAYLLYQVFVFPEMSTRLKVIDSILGLLSIIAGGIFFIKGRRDRKPRPRAE
jgi:hypothetical protein